MKKVQQIVRGLPTGSFVTCYRDVSYSRSKMKIRFKFCGIHPQDSATLIETVKQALTAEGHTFVDVQAHLHETMGGELLIWQKFPIQILEE
jgi:hypothetical protein